MEVDEHKAKKKAVADWRVKSEQVNEAREKRSIVVEVHGLSMFDMYVQPQADEVNYSRQNAAPQCGDGAGSDPHNNASGAIPSSVGGVPCMLMVSSGAGGDAYVHLVSKRKASSRRARESAKAESCSRDPLSRNNSSVAVFVELASSAALMSVSKVIDIIGCQ